MRKNEFIEKNGKQIYNYEHLLRMETKSYAIGYIKYELLK